MSTNNIEQRNIEQRLVSLGFIDSSTDGFHNLFKNKKRIFSVYNGNLVILGSCVIPSYNSTHGILSLMVL